MYYVGRTYVLQNVFLETQNQNVFTERLANVKSVNFKICCRDNAQSIDNFIFIITKTAICTCSKFYTHSHSQLTTELAAFCPVQLNHVKSRRRLLKPFLRKGNDFNNCEVFLRSSLSLNDKWEAMATNYFTSTAIHSLAICFISH